MKIIKENIDNFEDIKVTPVVDSVTADAIEQDKKTRKTFDEYTSVNKRTFLGAEKQPVPDEPVEPDAGMKVSLDESLFEAYHSEPRYYTNKFLEMLDDGLIDANEMCEAFAKWLSEDDMQRFMDEYELIDDEIDESLNEGRKAKPMVHGPSGEVFTDDDRSGGLDKETNHDLWSTVYDELAPGHPNVWGNTKFKDYVFSDRYTDDQIFPEDDAISIYVENEDQLEFAKKVADEFDLNYKIKNNGEWYVKNHPDRAVVMKIYIPFD